MTGIPNPGNINDKRVWNNPATEEKQDTLNASILKTVGLGLPEWDYVSNTNNATSNVYVFKTGGAGGTTVATVTVNYVDSTKAVLLTAIRT